jgi:hypothetical protein
VNHTRKFMSDLLPSFEIIRFMGGVGMHMMMMIMVVVFKFMMAMMMMKMMMMHRCILFN